MTAKQKNESYGQRLRLIGMILLSLLKMSFSAKEIIPKILNTKDLKNGIIGKHAAGQFLTRSRQRIA